MLSKPNDHRRSWRIWNFSYDIFSHSSKCLQMKTDPDAGALSFRPTTWPIENWWFISLQNRKHLEFSVIMWTQSICIFQYIFTNHLLFFFLQFWMLPLGKRQCKSPQKARAYRKKPSTDLPHLSSLPTHARWPGKSAFHGGTWTFSSPTWFNWCDWTLENRVAVSCALVSLFWTNNEILFIFIRVNLELKPDERIVVAFHFIRKIKKSYVRLIWRMMNDRNTKRIEKNTTYKKSTCKKFQLSPLKFLLRRRSGMGTN